MQTRVTHWGNSLGIRIPMVLVKHLKLRPGQHLQFEIKKDGVLLQKAQKKYDLDELISNITPVNAHEAIDFGPAVGQEIW